MDVAAAPVDVLPGLPAGVCPAHADRTKSARAATMGLLCLMNALRYDNLDTLQKLGGYLDAGLFSARATMSTSNRESLLSRRGRPGMEASSFALHLV